MKRERKFRWWRDGTWWREKGNRTDYLLYPFRFIRRIYTGYKIAFLVIRLEKLREKNRELMADKEFIRRNIERLKGAAREDRDE
jgi:hypothetical protein